MTDASDESLPLRDLQRLAGGCCRDCGRVYTAREAVGSIALGFRDTPRCLPCLARRLGRPAAELRTDLVGYARRRECYARAWAAAEVLDGPAPDWPPLSEAGELPSDDEAPPRPEPSQGTAAAWDAGGLGCGELVMELRGRLNALPPGAVLKVTATDPAAPEDLPAWCRLTRNELVRMNHPEYHIRRKES